MIVALHDGLTNIVVCYLFNCIASHLVTVPPGVLPSDVLVSSPVLHGEDSGMAAAMGGAPGGGGNDSFAEYGGVDPSLDPELALVGAS